MATSSYSQVTNPDELLRVQGLFGEENNAQAPANVSSPVDMSAAPSTPFTSGVQVEDEDTLARVQALFDEQSTSNDSVSPHTLVNGLMLEGVIDQEVDPFDWKKMTAGMAASIAASIPQGKKGYKWGQKMVATLPNRGWLGAIKKATPVVTGAARGSLASAGALGATEFNYDAIESLVSGEEFNPSEAFDAAWDAARTDFIYSSAGSLGFPAVAKSYRAGKEYVSELPSLFPAKKIPIAGKAGLGDKSIAAIEKLQGRLVEMGGSLLPSMVSDRALPRYLEQVAKVSKYTKGTLENYFNIYGQFMGEQIDGVVKMYANKGPREQGKVLKAFIEQNERALAKVVEPLYTSLAVKGRGVAVNVREAAKAKADEISQSGLYRAQPKIDKDGNPIPQTSASGKVATVLAEMRKMPDNLNFYEAHQRLSKIKSDIADLRASTNPDSNAVNVLEEYRTLLENGMEGAADKLSPTLRKEYDEVTAYYSRGKKVVTAEWLASAMRNSDPATIGRILTQDGLSEGIIQIKQLRKAAADFKKDIPKPPKGASKAEVKEYKEMLKGLDVDPLEGIRRGFLDEILMSAPDDAISSAEKFGNKLKQPRFRETFNELFKGTAVPAKIDEMLENLMILSRTDTSQQGFALTVAGAEQQVLTNPNAKSILKSIVPAFLASNQISAKSIDKLINLQKVAIAAESKGVTLSQGFYTSLEKLVGRGNITGTVISAPQSQ
tara:strand:- start:4519 stop:6678 length:2160 start_codon:yes stop_codon:yes gene_type:complete